MILAEKLYVEKVRKEVEYWHKANDYPGYNYVLAITEWELNKNGLTMYSSKEQQ